MKVTELREVLGNEKVDPKVRIEQALAMLGQAGKGNVHLLAQIFGKDSLNDIPIMSQMTFVDLYRKYNAIRPLKKDETRGECKDLPTKMWKDQGISYSVFQKGEVAMFQFNSYNEAQHVIFRAKNAASKAKKAAAEEDVDVEVAEVEVAA